ncbi:MAG: hypothetical protein ACK5QX_04325 [bacterium]
MPPRITPASGLGAKAPGFAVLGRTQEPRATPGAKTPPHRAKARRPPPPPGKAGVERKENQ